MTTIHDRLVAALIARGETVVKGARTTKYTVVTRHNGGFYYIGKAGALRIGQTIADSRSAPNLRARLLDCGGGR